MGIAQNLYYRWSKDFLEAGKKRLAGDTARAATSAAGSRWPTIRDAARCVQGQGAMSSRQILANRANAKASTGPKTVQGKARVAQNARRHGLALSVMADTAHSAAVETLAHEVVGADSRPDILHLARRVARSPNRPFANTAGPLQPSGA